MKPDDELDDGPLSVARTAGAVPATRKAWEAVYEYLRDAILSERLPPGTRLVEMSIAEEAGLSQGPVREALARLEEQGLVEALGRRGRYVASVPVETGRMLYELRSRVEPLAAKLAMQRMTPADLEELQGYVQLIGQSVSVAARVDADMAFHRRIYELADFPPLASLWEQLEMLTRRLRPVSAAALTYGIHRDIVDALAKRDEAELNRALDVHMKHTWSPAEARSQEAGS